MSSPDVHPELSWQQKLLVLTAAFLGWMFAGLQIALFVLITANPASTIKVRPAKPDPKSKARTMISRSGGAVIGSLLGGVLATLLGRRLTYFLISLLSLCGSCLIFGWLDPLHPWFLWGSFAFGLVGVIYFGWLPLYLPELFPTRVRATGTGISFNSGRAWELRWPASRQTSRCMWPQKSAWT